MELSKMQEHNHAELPKESSSPVDGVKISRVYTNKIRAVGSVLVVILLNVSHDAQK